MSLLLIKSRTISSKVSINKDRWRHWDTVVTNISGLSIRNTICIHLNHEFITNNTFYTVHNFFIEVLIYSIHSRFKLFLNTFVMITLNNILPIRNVNTRKQVVNLPVDLRRWRHWIPREKLPHIYFKIDRCKRSCVIPPHERFHNGLVPAHRPHTGFLPCSTACTHPVKSFGHAQNFHRVSPATNGPQPCSPIAHRPRRALTVFHRSHEMYHTVAHGMPTRCHVTAA